MVVMVVGCRSCWTHLPAVVVQGNTRPSVMIDFETWTCALEALVKAISDDRQFGLTRQTCCRGSRESASTFSFSIYVFDV